jgi:hypothetical protein
LKCRFVLSKDRNGAEPVDGLASVANHP